MGYAPAWAAHEPYHEARMRSDLSELYELIDDIEIAMLTTRRPDGRLVSRPMQTQDVDSQFDLWFVTTDETEKFDEMQHDPNVNLAYYDDRSREWVSVSGRARLVRDRQQIERLYNASWRVWLEKKDNQRDGTASDPRIVLIAVDVDSVVYMKSKASAPMKAYEVVKSFVTGGRPDVAEVRHVKGRELG
jgi:general stress protein 26